MAVNAHPCTVTAYGNVFEEEERANSDKHGSSGWCTQDASSEL